MYCIAYARPSDSPPYITATKRNNRQLNQSKDMKRYLGTLRDEYLLNNLVMRVFFDSGMCWNFSSRISFHVTVASALNPEDSVLNEKYRIRLVFTDFNVCIVNFCCSRKVHVKL